MDLKRKIKRKVRRDVKGRTHLLYDPENWPKLPPFATSFRKEVVDHIKDLDYRVSCFLHIDEDIRTSQYVDSCGSAALTVALRHLHPGRLGQKSKTIDNTQPISDFDFTFEKSRAVSSDLTLSDIGSSLGVPHFLGRPGYTLWNQLTFYGLTKNQIGGLMNLFNKENDTLFRLYYHHSQPNPQGLEFVETKQKYEYESDEFFLHFTNSLRSLEECLADILLKNRLAIALVDGLIWSKSNHYTFPSSEEEWMKRTTNKHLRPDDCLAVEENPILQKMRDLLVANGCLKENQARCPEEFNPQDQEHCYKLCHMYEEMRVMDDSFKATTIGHAVVVSGMYVHAESARVLWRVLDSNPTTRLNLKKSIKNRSRQGSVNFMTTLELYNRMVGTLEATDRYRYVNAQPRRIDPNGHLRLLEVVPGKGRQAQADVSLRNLILPVIYSN
ncbi:hypothetical protein N9L85_02690 [Euryarchaeota archaeon]|nr:hypothetical protein [Euryarchaeota archaeon]